MRHLLLATLSSLTLAALIAGPASAAGMAYPSKAPAAIDNSALQAQFDRDSELTGPWLRRSPLGQVIATGKPAQSAQTTDHHEMAMRGHLLHDN